jgi:hypothetical protein
LRTQRRCGASLARMRWNTTCRRSRFTSYPVSRERFIRRASRLARKALGSRSDIVSSLQPVPARF